MFEKNGDYYFNTYKLETHNILCSSWLLSAEVLKCLDGKSNIRKFSELFYIKKGKSAEKDEAVVEMTLGDDVKNVYTSKYLTYLPSKEELIRIIKNEKELIELAKKEDDKSE